MTKEQSEEISPTTRLLLEQNLLNQYANLNRKRIHAERTGEVVSEKTLDEIRALEDRIEEVKPGWKADYRSAQPRREDGSKPRSSTPNSEFY